MKDKSATKSLRRLAIPALIVALLIAVVVTVANGSQLARQRVQGIFMANHLATNYNELIPPYTGDPSLNAASALDALDSEVNRNSTSSGAKESTNGHDVTKAFLDSVAGSFPLGERVTDCPVYIPRGLKESFGGDSSDRWALDSMAQRFAMRAQVRAEDGNLKGALADMKRVVTIANYNSLLPALSYARSEQTAASYVAESVVGLAPQFKGHEEETGELKKILPSLKPLNFARILEGEACIFYDSCGDGLEAARPSTGWSEHSDQTNWLQYFVLQPIWVPQFAQAFADDIRDLKKDPSNSMSPALKLPHLQAVSASCGYSGSLAPNFKEFRLSYLQHLSSLQLAGLAVDAITSGSLPQVSGTVDPLGSGPYKLITKKNGWVLYSAGVDGMDDGGALQGSDSPNHRHDVGVQYLDGSTQGSNL